MGWLLASEIRRLQALRFPPLWRSDPLRVFPLPGPPAQAMIRFRVLLGAGEPSLGAVTRTRPESRPGLARGPRIAGEGGRAAGVAGLGDRGPGRQAGAQREPRDSPAFGGPRLDPGPGRPVVLGNWAGRVRGGASWSRTLGDLGLVAPAPQTRAFPGGVGTVGPACCTGAPGLRGEAPGTAAAPGGLRGPPTGQGRGPPGRLLLRAARRSPHLF